MGCCRNFFALRPEELQALVAACDKCLQDEKLEIRSLAGATLSGLLKVLPADLAEALRGRILQQGRDMFPVGRVQKMRGPSVTQQHSCVIRLAALLSSSPYTICDWCARCLLPACSCLLLSIRQTNMKPRHEFDHLPLSTPGWKAILPAVVMGIVTQAHLCDWLQETLQRMQDGRSAGADSTGCTAASTGAHCRYSGTGRIPQNA